MSYACLCLPTEPLSLGSNLRSKQPRWHENLSLRTKKEASACSWEIVHCGIHIIPFQTASQAIYARLMLVSEYPVLGSEEVVSEDVLMWSVDSLVQCFPKAVPQSHNSLRGLSEWRVLWSNSCRTHYILCSSPFIFIIQIKGFKKSCLKGNF